MMTPHGAKGPGNLCLCPAKAKPFFFETGEDVVGIGSPCHVPPGMNNLVNFPHLHSSPLTSSSLCYISIHRLGQA
jgi:hypothetical protein